MKLLKKHSKQNGNNPSREDLELSLSLLKATLESTADGILVIGKDRTITSYNQKFLKIWNIPPSVVENTDSNSLLSYVIDQLEEPEKFLTMVRQLYSHPEKSSEDVIEFKGGKIVERYSQPHMLGEEIVGRVWSFRDVTAQKKAEKEQKISEQKYHKIFENVQDVFFIADEKARLTDISPSIKRHTEFSVEEVIGKPIYNYYRDKRERVRFQRELNKTGELNNFESQMVTKSGEVVHVSANAHFIYSSDNNIIGIEGSLKNITESKMAEFALKEAHDNWDRTFRSIKDGIALLDTDHRILQFNQAFIDFTGRSRKELLGKYCFNHVHGTECAISECPFVRMKQSGTREKMELQIRDRVFDIIVDPIVDPDGNVTGAVHLMNDITDRKMAEERYRVLIETMQEGIMQSDLNDVILFVNKRICDIFGYEPSELIGKTGYSLLIHEDHKSTVIEKTLRRLEGKSDMYEVMGMKKSGEIIWVSINGAPLYDKVGTITGSVGIISDITERKKNEEEIIKLKEGLEKEVAKKTIELKDKITDLQRFVDATVDRELRMEELHNEIERLKSGIDKQTE